MTVTRRVIAPANKEMIRALEQTGANLGIQDHFTRGVTHVAKQFGVQTRDLKLIGEFEDVKGGGEKLVRVFHGFKDPNPNPDSYRELISFDEALKREWKPAR